MFVEEKKQGEVTEAPTEITKLSQAIRKGATKHPQCVGAYFDGSRSCAFGAAWEGVYGFIDVSTALIASWASSYFRLPSGMIIEIIERNDKLGQSREQIADWLEAQGY